MENRNHELITASEQVLSTDYLTTPQKKKRNLNTLAQNSASQFGLVQPVTLESGVGATAIYSYCSNSGGAPHADVATAPLVGSHRLGSRVGHTQGCCRGMPCQHRCQVTSDAGAWCYLSPLICFHGIPVPVPYVHV